MEKKAKKQSMGRRKIEIKKIEKKSDLQVTFCKRRSGLFRKAGEFSVLTGVDIAILVESPSKKIYCFVNPSVDSIIDRYLQGESYSPQVHMNLQARENTEKKYWEAMEKLKTEKEITKAIKETKAKREESLSFYNLGLHDAEEYKAAIQRLKNNVMARANEMAMAMAMATSSSLIPNVIVEHDLGGVAVKHDEV